MKEYNISSVLFTNNFPKLLFTILFFLISSINIAQWNLSVSTNQEYSDNPFHTILAEKTFISSIELGLEKDFDFLSIGYYGSYYNFSFLTDRNFYAHQFSITKNFENSILGGIVEQRFGKDIYTFFNYTNFLFYYQHTFNLGPIYISLSPNLSLTDYHEIPILNNIKTSFSYIMNCGLESETTLILGGSLNHKKYIDPINSGVYNYFNEYNNIVHESFSDRNVESFVQLLSYLRAAQSITSSTGLAVQYTNRSIFTKFDNSVKDLNIYYGDESEMFDDPVNYEGNNYSIELTQILFEDLEIKLGYYANNKLYPSQGIYDPSFNYDNQFMRKDNQKIFNVSLKKNLQLDFLNDVGVFLGINYRHINNQSNSALFNYKSNSFNINFGLEL